MPDGFPLCQCCGGPCSSFTIGGDEDAGLVALCDFCADLEEAGMLRREVHDGEVRYREWRFTWTPGELRSKVEQPRKAANR